MSLFKSPGWGIQKGLTETPGECGRLAVALLCVSRDGNDNEELTVLTLPDSITPTSLAEFLQFGPTQFRELGTT